MEVKSKKLPKSQIELEFELTAEEFKKHFEHALSHMKSHVKVDGFRPGQAPDKLVEERIKPESLLMEAGDHAVKHAYLKYIKENNLEPVSQPEVKIKKIAKGSELIFTATITVLPDVELPDYKEIAKTVGKPFGTAQGGEISVTEEEVQDSLNYLQKSRAKFTAKNEPAEKGDFVEITYQSKDIEDNKPAKDAFVLGEAKMVKGFEENLEGMKSGEEKDFSVDFPKDYHNKNLAGKGVAFHIKMVSAQKMELPEINDEFAKQLGTFDNLAALKESMRQGVELEKKEAEKQRVRGEILEKITEKTKFEMPESMVEHEKQRLMDDLKQRVTQNMKITFEQYLAAVKQTEDQLKETFQKEAEKRLRGFLVLRELGKKENIQVSDEEVEEEVNKNLKIEKLKNLKQVDSSPFAKGERVDINELKEYTKGVIHNEKIFQLLESFGK